jgi:hypothetical protein
MVSDFETLGIALPRAAQGRQRQQNPWSSPQALLRHDGNKTPSVEGGLLAGRSGVSQRYCGSLVPRADGGLRRPMFAIATPELPDISGPDRIGTFPTNGRTTDVAQHITTKNSKRRESPNVRTQRKDRSVH